MSDCSFLSTEEDKIPCFQECPFYKYEDNDGSCPFKNVSVVKKLKVKDYPYDFLYDEEGNMPFPNIYKEQYD